MIIYLLIIIIMLMFYFLYSMYIQSSISLIKRYQIRYQIKIDYTSKISPTFYIILYDSILKDSDRESNFYQDINTWLNLSWRADTKTWI